MRWRCPTVPSTLVALSLKPELFWLGNFEEGLFSIDQEQKGSAFCLKGHQCTLLVTKFFFVANLLIRKMHFTTTEHFRGLIDEKIFRRLRSRSCIQFGSRDWFLAGGHMWQHMLFFFSGENGEMSLPTANKHEVKIQDIQVKLSFFDGLGFRISSTSPRNLQQSNIPPCQERTA